MCQHLVKGSLLPCISAIITGGGEMPRAWPCPQTLSHFSSAMWEPGQQNSGTFTTSRENNSTSVFNFKCAGCVVNNGECGWTCAGCFRQHVCAQQLEARAESEETGPLRRYGCCGAAVCPGNGTQMKFSSDFRIHFKSMSLSRSGESSKTMWVLKWGCKHWLLAVPAQSPHIPPHAQASVPLSPFCSVLCFSFC